MKLSLNPRVVALLGLAVLALYALDAHAQSTLTNSGIFDRVLEKYRSAAYGWTSVIMTAATRLFWVLAAISLGFTFGFMLLRRADISEFFIELVRFIMTTGFFLWLMVNAPDYAPRILNGLRQLAGKAGGLGGPALSPSQVVDMGFAIFFRVVNESSGWSPLDSLAGMVASAAILILLVLVGINILLVLIGSWVLTYGGLFFLGFGGGRWTTDMAIGYYRTVLKVGIELMTMVLLVAIGSTFLTEHYRDLGNSTRLTDLVVVMVASLILLVLVNKVPPLISSVASGGPVGGSGLGGVGAGALMAGAGMAMAAAGAGAALMGAAAVQAMGGVQAVQAAFKATSSGAGGGAGGASGGGGGMPGLGWTGGSGAAGGASGGGSGGSGGGSGWGSDGGASPFASAGGLGGSTGGGSGGKPGGTAGGAGVGAGGKPSFGQRMAAVGDQIKRGAQAMAVNQLRESGTALADRVAQTPGAKLAEAIRTANGMGAGPADNGPIFDADSLSPGDDTVFDPDAEVAAFAAGAESAPPPAGPARGTVDDEGMFDSNRT